MVTRPSLPSRHAPPQDLLPRMQLAGFSSAVLHPLIRLLDGPSDELRERALDTLCSVSLAIGPDFAIFVPTIKKVWVADGRGQAHCALFKRWQRSGCVCPAFKLLGLSAGTAFA